MLPTDIRARANPQSNIPGPQPTTDNPNADPRLGTTTTSSAVDPYSQPLFFPSFHAPNQTRVQFDQLINRIHSYNATVIRRNNDVPPHPTTRSAVPVVVDSTATRASTNTTVNDDRSPVTNVFEAWQRQRQLLGGASSGMSTTDNATHNFVRDSAINQRNQHHSASSAFSRHQHHFPMNDGPSGGIGGGGSKSELDVSWGMLKSTFDRFFDDQIEGCAPPGGSGGSAGGGIGGYSSQQLYTAVFTTLSNFLGAQLYNTVHRYILWRVLHLRDCLLRGAFTAMRTIDMRSTHSSNTQPPSESSSSSTAAASAGSKRVRTDDNDAPQSPSPQTFKVDDFEVVIPVIDCDNIHLDSIEFTAVGKVTDWAPGLSESDKVDSFIRAHSIFLQAVSRMGNILLHLNHNYCSRNSCRPTGEMAALAFAQHFILTPTFNNNNSTAIAEVDGSRDDVLSEMGVLAGVDPRLDDLWEVFGRGTGKNSPSRKRQYNPISQSLLRCVSNALHIRRSPFYNSSSFNRSKLNSMRQLVKIVFDVDVSKVGCVKEAERIQYGVVSRLWSSSGNISTGEGQHRDGASRSTSDAATAAAAASSSSSSPPNPTTNTPTATTRYLSHHAENDSCVALLLAVPFVLNSAYHSLNEALISLLGTDGAKSVFEAAGRNGGGAAATALPSRQKAVETLLHTLPRSIDLAEYADHLHAWHHKEDNIQQLFTTDAHCMARELEDPLLPYLLLPRYHLVPSSSSNTTTPSSSATSKSGTPFPLRYDNTPGSMYYLLATRQLAKLKTIAHICQRMGEGKCFQAHLEVLLNALGSGILYGGVGMMMMGAQGGRDGGVVLPQKADPVTDLMLRAAAGLYIGEHMNDVGVAWLTEQLHTFASNNNKKTATSTRAPSSSVLLYLSPQSNPLGSTAHIGTSSLSEASLAGGSLPLPTHSIPSLHFLQQLYAGGNITITGSKDDGGGSTTTNRLSTVESIACFYVMCQSLLAENWTIRTVINTNHPLASNTTTATATSPTKEHVVSMFVFKDSSRLLSPAVVDDRTLGGPLYEVSLHHHKIIAAVRKSLRVVFNRDSSLPIMFNHSLDWLISVATHGEEMMMLQQQQQQSSTNASLVSPHPPAATKRSGTTVVDDVAHFSMKISKLLSFWSTVVFDLYISLEEGEPFEVAFYHFLSQRLLRRYRGALMSVGTLEESAGYAQHVDALIGRGSSSSSGVMGASGQSMQHRPNVVVSTTVSPAKSPRLQSSSTHHLLVTAAEHQDALHGFDGGVHSSPGDSRGPPGSGGFPSRTRDENATEWEVEVEEGVDGGAQLGLQPHTTLSSTTTQGLSGLANSSHEAVFIRLLRFFVGTTVTSKIDSMFGDCKVSEDINREFRRRFGVVPPIAVRTCWVTEATNSRTSTIPVIPFLSSKLLLSPTTSATPAATITPHTLVPLQYDVVAFAMGETQSSAVLNFEDTSSNPYRKKEAESATSSSSAAAMSGGGTNLMATPLLQQLVSSPVLPHALSVSILTKGLWPAFPTSSDIMLPVAATRTFQVFKKYYLTKYTNRRLELCKRLGTFEISMCVPSLPSSSSSDTTEGGSGATPTTSRTYNLLVPTQCAPVLLLFDDVLSGGVSTSSAKTIQVLCHLTNQSEQEVMAVVTACVDGLRYTTTTTTTSPTPTKLGSEASIFKLGGSSRSKSGALLLTPNTTVEFNSSFYHPSLDIGIGFVTPPLLTGASYSSHLLPTATNTSSSSTGARSSSSLAAGESSSMLGSGGGAGGSTDGGEGSGGVGGSGGGGPPRSIALDRNRRTQVSVTIVRLLKKESPMPHSVLLEWTQSILLHHFSLSVEDFKREVETLIGKQFVARVEGASVPSYKYTA